MKNILLPILFLFFAKLSFSQSIDLAIFQPSVTQLAAYPEWMTETLNPSVIIIKDSLIDLEVNATFKIVQLAGNSIVHEENLSILSLSGTQQLAEFVPFVVTSLPIGDYQIQYDVTSSFLDGNLDNNFFVHNFQITEDEFAFGLEVTDFIHPAPGNYNSVEPHAWAFACPVKFQNLPDDAVLGEMNFAIGNPQELIGQFTPISIYVWDEDANFDGGIDPSERRFVAFGAYTVTGDELPGENISVEISSINGEDWIIEENKFIIFSFEHVNNLPNSPMKLGVDNTPNLNNPNNIITSVNPLEDNGRVYLGLNGDLSTEPYTPALYINGFNGNLGLTLMPLPAAGFTVVSLSSTKPNTTPKHQIKLLENPVQELLQLEINSQALQPKYINIYNTMGQGLYAEKLDAMSDRIAISVGDFPNGTYHVIIYGDNGNAVSTFVKTN